MTARRYVVTMATWFSSVAGLFRRRERAALTAKNFEGGLLAGTTFGRGPPARGTRELIQAYREQPWLRAVTGRIARGISSARWAVYVRADASVRAKGRLAPAWRWGVDRGVRDLRLITGPADARARHRRELQAAGMLREVTDHPVLELLCKPNPLMTGQTAIRATQIWLDIKGEAFWVVVRGTDGSPAQVWPVPPHWVRQVPAGDQRFFVVALAGIEVKVPAADMVWLRDVDPEQPYGRGTGVAESLGDELEADEYAAKYIKSWFFNSATPSLIVSFDGASVKELDVALEKWEAKHRGTHNAHRTHFAVGKMNAVKLDTAFKDQQLVELRRMERDTVVQVFGVPPECIGIIENSNRATIDAAQYMYAIGVEHPRLEFLRNELTNQLLPMYAGGEVVALEVESTMPQDAGRRLEVMKAQPGAFELNEWREEAGFDARPEFEGKFAAGLPGQSTQPAALPAGGEPDDAEVESESADDEETDMRRDPLWARRLPR